MRGTISGVAAYVLWALFPLYFKLVERSGALEVVAYRVVCSLLLALLLLWGLGRWRSARSVIRDRRSRRLLALAGFLVAANWSIYVVGVVTDKTLDAALGYFINPLVAAALGVLVLRESLSRVQWLAFGIGAVAVVVLVLGYGEVPWIALGVATTFGIYGLLKKQLGATVAPLPGLAVETAAVAPVALAYLAWLQLSGLSTVSPVEPYGWLVYLSGPVTLVPLLLFAAGAKEMRLVTLGMIQYIAPIGQFLLGWLVFDEPMPPERWLGFLLVWLAVAIFAASAIGQYGSRRRAAMAAH